MKGINAAKPNQNKEKKELKIKLSEELPPSLGKYIPHSPSLSPKKTKVPKLKKKKKKNNEERSVQDELIKSTRDRAIYLWSFGWKTYKKLLFPVTSCHVENPSS